MLSMIFHMFSYIARVSFIFKPCAILVARLMRHASRGGTVVVAWPSLRVGA